MEQINKFYYHLNNLFAWLIDQLPNFGKLDFKFCIFFFILPIFHHNFITIVRNWDESHILCNLSEHHISITKLKQSTFFFSNIVIKMLWIFDARQKCTITFWLQYYENAMKPQFSKKVSVWLKYYYNNLVKSIQKNDKNVMI